MTSKKSATPATNNDINESRIVSSRHLISERCAELSELEYALIMTSNAFNKWMVRCMTAAGEPDMGAFDVSLLHHVNHRDRKKKLVDICFVLNVEDTHVVTYALKKLVKAGYVTSEKVGKELYFYTTEEGKALCMKYRDVREACLISIQVESGIPGHSIGETAQLLRTISSLYDTAARAAALAGDGRRAKETQSALTAICRASNASRSRRANASACGPSPCRHTVWAFTSAQTPSRLITRRFSTISSVRATASSSS